MFNNYVLKNWLLGQFLGKNFVLETNWPIFGTFSFKISIQAPGFAFRY